jgi:hypothetical protein
MENTSIIPDELVANKIYFIRNQKIMIDSDLAELYDVETRVLNQAVNRNIERFPEDFMFQLTEEEWQILMSQIVISKTGRGGRRKLPYVFTEHGVLMLSSVLNSASAIMINIQIVRIFSRMRQLYLDHTELRLEVERIKKDLKDQGKNIEIVFRYLDELINKQHEPPKRRQIGYKPDEC